MTLTPEQHDEIVEALKVVERLNYDLRKEFAIGTVRWSVSGIIDDHLRKALKLLGD